MGRVEGNCVVWTRVVQVALGSDKCMCVCNSLIGPLWDCSETTDAGSVIIVCDTLFALTV